MRRWNDGSTAEQTDGALAGESEVGFTLIELMVVLLIMAILLAIAIPTFLGVKTGAQDRSAQSNLTNALISTKAIEVGNSGGLTTTLISSLASQEPELTFVFGAISSPVTSSNPQTIAVEYDGGGAILTNESSGGVCWVITLNDTGSVQASSGSNQIGMGTWYGRSSGGSSCSTQFAGSTTWSNATYPTS